MRAFIEERAKLVIAVVITVVAIVGYIALSGEGSSERAMQVSDTILGPKERAEDTSAQSLLQNAALAMESWFTTNQTFAGSATGVAAIEPNIAWTAGGATAAANQVSVAVGPDQSSYTLTTAAASGTNFTYARDAQAEIQRTCGAGCTW